MVEEDGTACCPVSVGISPEYVNQWIVPSRDGSFHFHDVPLGFVDLQVSRFGIDWLRPIAVPVGDLEIVLRVPACSWIQGRLPEGVWSIRGWGEFVGVSECESDLDGEFRFGPIPRGSQWTIHMTNADGRVAVCRIHASGEFVSIAPFPEVGGYLFLGGLDADKALVATSGGAIPVELGDSSVRSVLVPVGPASISFLRSGREQGNSIHLALTARQRVLVQNPAPSGSTRTFGVRPPR